MMKFMRDLIQAVIFAAVAFGPFVYYFATMKP